jgi:hypothetical protein
MVKVLVDFLKSRQIASRCANLLSGLKLCTDLLSGSRFGASMNAFLACWRWKVSPLIQDFEAQDGNPKADM